MDRTDRPPVPNPLLPPLNDCSRFVEQLARITGVDEGKVRERLHRELLSFGTVVREELERRGITPHVSSPALEALYGDTDSFLYELGLWNRSPPKLKMRTWVARFLRRQQKFPLDVLAFGDGMGFDSAHLALAGHRVTYFEVADLSIRFAQELFANLKVDIRHVMAVADLPRESFDAILCLDVLEHVDDPPGLTGLLAGLLRPGGFLVASAPFCTVGPEFATHLDSNRKYSGRLESLYLSQGLELHDGTLDWNPLVFRKVPAGKSTHRNDWLKRLDLRAAGWVFLLARYFPGPFIRLAKGARPRDDEWLQALR